MSTRIYNVFDGKADRLVRAGNQAQAIRHVAKSSFKVRVASQDDIVDVVSHGGKVEEASNGEDDAE